MPRFPYEEHCRRPDRIAALAAVDDRINEIRIEIDFERGAGWRSGPATLALDVVDYPGEWLLDLALIDADYGAWSRQTLEASVRPSRAAIAAPWRAHLDALDPAGPADETVAEQASEAFKAYLAALRAGPEAVATTPPGRFLMPGDLAGSPALTFAPLALPRDAAIAPRTLASLMERRFEAYKARVVRPFFRDHFQRIDRQIVLVDVLAAVDAGPAALAELEEALDHVLIAFNAGRNTLSSRLFAPRADRVLFAATKADHVHHTSHDRLERLLRLLVKRALRRTEAAGARVGTVALAAVRATRETTVREGGLVLRAVAGTPEAGERIGGEVFDGESEAAVFPGELPERPEAVLEGAVPPGSLRFPRFRPPRRPPDAAGRPGRCRRSASTARSSSCWGTDWHDDEQAARLPPRRARRGHGDGRGRRAAGAARIGRRHRGADGGDRGGGRHAVPLRPRRAPWVGVLLSALGGLVTLAIGLGVERLVAELFAVAPWLGWVALALTVVALVAFLAIVAREAAGVFRERRIERLRAAAIDALAVRDHQAAKTVAADLASLYGERPEAGQGRRTIESLAGEILDAEDRLAIAERELLAPLDAQARRDHRGRGAAGLGRDGDQPARDRRRGVRGLCGRAASAARRAHLRRPPRGARLPPPGAGRLQPPRRDRRDGGRGQPAPAAARPRAGRARLGQARRGRAQRPDDRALRSRGARRLPAAAVRPGGAAAPRRRRRRAVVEGPGRAGGPGVTRQWAAG